MEHSVTGRKAEGVPRQWPEPAFPESCSGGHWANAIPESCPSHRRTHQREAEGCAFTDWAVPWEGQPAKSHLSDCHSPMGPRNVGPFGRQSQTIKGLPLGGSCKIRAPDVKTRALAKCKSPFQETLELWSVAKGECKDSAHPPRSLERITVSPWMPV